MGGLHRPRITTPAPSPVRAHTQRNTISHAVTRVRVHTYTHPRTHTPTPTPPPLTHTESRPADMTTSGHSPPTDATPHMLLQVSASNCSCPAVRRAAGTQLKLVDGWKKAVGRLAGPSGGDGVHFSNALVDTWGADACVVCVSMRAPQEVT